MTPKGWKNKRLSEVFEFKNGVNADKEQYGSGVKFINVSEIFKSNSIYESDIPGSVDIDDSKIELYLVKKGDVLFNRTSETFNEIGLTAVYLDTPRVVFGGFVIRARPTTKELSPEYCKYAFSTNIMRREIIRRGQGAIRANIGQGDLSNVPMLIPSLCEQQKIAKILYTWDDAIEKLKDLISAKKKRNKGLIQQLLTGEKRFDGFDQVFESQKIGAFSKSFSGGTPNRGKKHYYINGTIPWMKSGEVNQRYVKSVEEKITEEALKNSSAKIVKKDTVVIALYGATAGKVAITEIETTTNQAVLAIFPNDNVDYKYLFHALEFIIPRYIGFAQGGQANLSGAIVREIKIAMPCFNEQKKISAFCDLIDNELIKLEKEKNKLVTQKRGLMQQLLTGKTRVRVS